MAMRRRPGRWRDAVVAVFVVAAAACGGGDDDEGSAAPPVGEPAAETTRETQEHDAGDDVGLDDAGREPRTPLRFQFAEGREQRSAMTMRMGFETSLDGEPTPSAPVPAMRMIMTTRIDRVDGDRATVSFSYEGAEALPEPGVRAQQIEQLDQALEQIVGVRGEVRADRRGVASGSSFDTSSVSDPTTKSLLDGLKSQLESLTIPFPSEAVGEGARWTARRNLTLNGITVEVATTYTLRSRSGDRYELGVEQVQTARSGGAALPGLPAGAEAEIVHYEITSTGSVTGRLDFPMPATSAMEGGGDIEFRLREGGETAELRQHLTIDVSLGDA